jgi:cytochrome c
MTSASTTLYGRLALGLAASALAIAGCSKKAPEDTAASEAPAAAPAADNVDTISGVKYASFTGDAAKGKTAFITCQTCHAVEAGVNKIGPSLHGIVGRTAGSIAGYTYSAANKNSGITWTPEKLFQYLEKPQRVVPGTKMAFPGIPDPQKRADVIAYLQTNG